MLRVRYKYIPLIFTFVPIGMVLTFLRLPVLCTRLLYGLKCRRMSMIDLIRKGKGTGEGIVNI